MKGKIEDYRTGAIGALTDEYERVLHEILDVLKPVNQVNFEKIMDEKTEDPDCKSMQTIMRHVIGAGYGYSYYIRKRFGTGDERIRPTIDAIENVGPEAWKMFEYFLNTTELLGDLQDPATWDDKWEGFLMRVPWNVVYDLEQLIEHAIVHVMRHRRQIEKFRIMQSE